MRSASGPPGGPRATVTSAFVTPYSFLPNSKHASTHNSQLPTRDTPAARFFICVYSCSTALQLYAVRPFTVTVVDGRWGGCGLGRPLRAERCPTGVSSRVSSRFLAARSDPAPRHAYTHSSLFLLHLQLIYSFYQRKAKLKHHDPATAGAHARWVRAGRRSMHR